MQTARAMKTSFAFASLAFALVACSGSTDSVADPTGSSSGTTPPGDTTSSTSPTQPSPSSTGTGTPTPTATATPVVGPPATAADCDAIASSYCTKLSACNYVAAKLFGTACESRMSSWCKARAAAPSTGLTSAGAQVCASALTTLTCDVAFGGSQPVACSFKGGLALNAQCAFDEQCATGNCSATETSCGKCVAAEPPKTPKVTVGLGETCDNSGTTAPQCNSALGLWCDSTKKCAAMPLVGVGQACGFVGQDLVLCEAGGSCRWGSNGSGICVTEIAEGGACNATNKGECAVGTTCVNGACGYATAAALCK